MAGVSSSSLFFVLVQRLHCSSSVLEEITSCLFICLSKVMSLFKYFKCSDPAHPKVLPQPDGPLATLMPSSSIVAANKEVKTALDSSVEHKTDEIFRKKSEKSSKRGRYDIYSPEEKASIGKRAAEHSTIRYYAKKYPKRPLLKGSSVRTWKNKYTAELGCRKRTGGDVDVTELPQKSGVAPFTRIVYRRTSQLSVKTGL